MEELTLEQAVRKCKESGGRFRELESETWYILNEDNFISMEEYAHEFMPLKPADFDTKWIYDPPQSAFQAWNSERTNSQTDFGVANRKEGWNAAIDAAIHCMRGYDMGELESLKEP